MASEDDKRKSRKLVSDAEYHYDSAKANQEVEAWAKDTLRNMGEAIELDPDNTKAWSWRGFAKNVLGDYQGAIDDCTTAIGLDPQNVVAWCERGFAKGHLGEHQGAIDDFTQAIELAPTNATIWNNRGKVRKELNDYKGAMDDYNKAIELDSRNASAWGHRGLLKNALGDYQGAIDDCTRAIEINPNYTPAWNNRGIAKDALGDHQGAIDDCTAAIQLDSKNANLWNNRALARDNSGDHQGAIDDYTKATELDPKNAIAWHGLGIAKYRLGRYNDALKDLDEALSLDPKDEVTQRNRQAVVLAIEGEKQAKETLKKEGDYRKELEEKSKQFHGNYDKCVQERDNLFYTIQKIIAGYILCLLIVIVIVIVFGPGWNFGDLFEHPFGLLPYFALLFIILSPFIWRIRITTREAERNLTMKEDYDARLIIESYLGRFFSDRRGRHEFAPKYMAYWMYNNPSETMIRLANKSTNQSELPQAEQIRNFTKNTPTDPQS